MPKFPKILILLLSVICLMSMTSSLQGVIKSKYKFLIGEYELISVQDQGKILTPNVAGKITMKVTKKDRLFIYNDGKLIQEYNFNSRRSPMPTETEKYVIFNLGEENYPLFFKGDSVIQFVYPNEYYENYFRKITAE